MRIAAALLSLVLAAATTASAGHKTSKRKAAAKAPPPPQAPAPVPSKASPDGPLADFGAELASIDGGLAAAAVRPDSPAWELGLRPGDRLAAFDGVAAKTPEEAASAWRAQDSRVRAYASAARDLSSERLEGDAPEKEPLFSRPSPSALSAQEAIFRDKRLKSSGAEAAARLGKELTDFVIPAGQSAWIKFPKGVPAEAKPGDVIEGLTTTPILADADLDFMALPPASRVWAEVLDAAGPAETRNLRLFFFKVQPPGRRTYALSARAAELEGDQRLARVSPGGTLVLAPGASLGAQDRLKAVLLEPLVLTEPSSYFQAGPGLWLKSDGRGFKAARVVPGRAAEKAGVVEGDPVVTINGKRVEQYDFAEAIALLYGPPGEPVNVGISRKKGGGIETYALVRGTAYKEGKASAVARPALAAPQARNENRSTLSNQSEQALDSLLKK